MVYVEPLDELISDFFIAAGAHFAIEGFYFMDAAQVFVKEDAGPVRFVCFFCVEDPVCGVEPCMLVKVVFFESLFCHFKVCTDAGDIFIEYDASAVFAAVS